MERHLLFLSFHLVQRYDNFVPNQNKVISNYKYQMFHIGHMELSMYTLELRYIVQIHILEILGKVHKNKVHQISHHKTHHNLEYHHLQDYYNIHHLDPLLYRYLLPTPIHHNLHIYRLLQHNHTYVHIHTDRP